MHGSRILRASAVAVVAASVTMTATQAADAATQTSVVARPSKKLPAVSGLAADAVASATGYVVHASWNALAGATSYRVKLTDNETGTILASGSVTGTTWSAPTTLPAGKVLTVHVFAKAAKRPGVEATASVGLPDVTAPVAKYSVLPPEDAAPVGDFKVRMDALTDDVSDLADITQSITWDDGTAEQSWPTTDPVISHSYAPKEHVYHPVVTVRDAAGNKREVVLTVVVADKQAPKGTFSATPSAGFARWTKISLQQTALTDDVSDPANITRMVNWGDDTPEEAWTGEQAPVHAYFHGGSFTPEVVLTDESGKEASVELGAVTVTVDETGPVVKLRRPGVRRAPSVKSWTTLRGTAKDAGVGVRRVRMQAVEKRGARWYAYRPATGTWVRAGATKAAALRKAPTAAFRPAADGTWSRRVRHLTKGTLVVRTAGVDKLGNAAPWSAAQQRLTRR